jgi:translation initiation factor IF-3
LAEVLLMRMAKDLEDNAEIQQPPKREGRNMIMFLSPRKAAAPKGNNAKPAVSAAAEPAG